ncbi:Fc receptor-like protein 5 isoform X4 [Rhinichthys klamathensis goyatoka]|uniref:Fc receptor-like protein 5 isoform X4 n=1 Tax=Rhinichthys klamathensis goyatoka TaxID=3034132 RepID=UPI0024B490CC|nr:Fc receptor-like protein 5 isoform X4 [Rhinichthys klamathensis goyatoka]
MESMHVSLILIGISVLYPRTGALDEHKLDEPVLEGPSVALNGSIEYFYCEIPGIPASVPVLYELYVESNPGRMIAQYSSLSGELATFPLLIKSQHDGRLVCKASGHNNTDIQSSLSQGLDLKVIVPVEDVTIAPHAASETVWEGQTLSLQCRESRGTYVSYEWLRNERPYDTTGDTLIIHRLSVQHTGNYTCVASNRFNDTMTFSCSDVISVQVKEYVSKPEISLEVVKLGDAGFRAIVTCRSLKGSPLITFSLLNDTDVITKNTTEGTSAIFHVPVELNRVTGRVRCNASNEGNWVLSEPVNLTGVLNSVSPALVLVVLSCFALLNAAVMACCVYGVVLRRRYSGKHFLRRCWRVMRKTSSSLTEQVILLRMRTNLWTKLSCMKTLSLNNSTDILEEFNFMEFNLLSLTVWFPTDTSISSLICHVLFCSDKGLFKARQ